MRRYGKQDNGGTLFSAIEHQQAVAAKTIWDFKQRIEADEREGARKLFEADLLKINAQEFLMRKATRNHPLPSAEVERNHRVSRIRVRVEHVFARMSQMGNDFCRSIGLKRAKSHNHLANLVYNMDRYACLAK